PPEPRDEAREKRDGDVGADPLDAVHAAGDQQRRLRAVGAAEPERVDRKPLDVDELTRRSPTRSQHRELLDRDELGQCGFELLHAASKATEAPCASASSIGWSSTGTPKARKAARQRIGNVPGCRSTGTDASVTKMARRLVAWIERTHAFAGAGPSSFARTCD